MNIVELGPRRIPIFVRSSEIMDRVNAGNLYIGLDVSEETLKTAKKGYPQENIWFSIGDAARIPLTDNSTDEIWATNTFGGGMTIFPKKQPSGSLLYTYGTDQYFEEMSRVIKPGGKIYIGEWFTPEDAVELKSIDYKKFGFEAEVYEGDAFKKFITEHGIYVGNVDDYENPFFIVLEDRRKAHRKYYEEKLGLHLTAEQFTIEEKFHDLYYRAKGKAMANGIPTFWKLLDDFDQSFTEEQREQKKHCLLYFSLLGSTPPLNLAPYVFDIEGKYQSLIPALEQLVKDAESHTK